MKTFNRVILMGHLGQTPKLQMSRSGRPFTRLNVATHRYRGQNAEGKSSESTEWHSVFVWGDQATHCTDYLKRGACVLVEGSLSYWQVAQDADSPSHNQYKNAIQADMIRFISYGKSGDLDNPQTALNHDAVAHPA